MESREFTDRYSYRNITPEMEDHLWEAYFEKFLQKRFSEPMLWIGLYIALASLICTLAMIADLLHGFRLKKLWFPCKYFTLNVVSLTVIAVAIKLPMDLTTYMPGRVDDLAKLGSLTFMCTIMANLLPSLANMDNKVLVSNMIALGLFVITLVVNVCIQIRTGVIYVDDHFLAKNFAGVLLMYFTIYTCSSIAILKSKQILESKYQAAHQTILKDQEKQQPGRINVEILKQHVSNYSIMAGTGCPQFMTACSVTTSATGVICVFSNSLYILRMSGLHEWSRDYGSDYKWSMLVIVIIQSIGVIVGTIAPLFRCFAALSFKLSIEWIGNRIKITVVVLCKVIAVIPVIFVIFCLCCFRCWKWLRVMLSAPGILLRQTREEQLQTQTDKEISPYVLQDDMEFAVRTLKGISKSVNYLIKKAEKQQPKNLIFLLAESRGFEGVEKFDNHLVPPLLSKEFLTCWSLTLVTLATIFMSLPNIQKNIIDSLLSGVSEGLVYVTLVEESLNANADHVSIQKATKTLWLEVEVYHKWLGNKLPISVAQANTVGRILQWLRDTAKNMVTEVESTNNGVPNDNSKCKSIFANSMYRITETILLSYHENIDQVSQEELFEQLSSMIADILSACLTNLPQLITMKCHTSVIEKREASVCDAAQLLGETVQIINNLKEREIPYLNPDDLAYIENWRNYLN